jgi:effector-binding domain-containing protein
VIEYRGGYGGLAGPHNAMDVYIQANNLEPLTPAIEEYVTDPMQEPDSTKWITKITYLVK